LGVSEIGLATESVTGTVKTLQDTLGVEIYDGQGSEEFTAVGDEHGLFIVVKRGCSWYPESGIPSGVYPLEIELSNHIRLRTRPGRVTGLEYEFARSQESET
jgi:catechol-2,3-dioxygenase